MPVGVVPVGVMPVGVVPVGVVPVGVGVVQSQCNTLAILPVIPADTLAAIL